MRKIAGTRNPADILTKPMGLTDIEPKLRSVGGHLERRKKADILNAKGPGPRWADIPIEEEIENENGSGEDY